MVRSSGSWEADQTRIGVNADQWIHGSSRPIAKRLTAVGDRQLPDDTDFCPDREESYGYDSAGVEPLVLHEPPRISMVILGTNHELRFHLP
jgi:hypothetical protein